MLCKTRATNPRLVLLTHENFPDNPSGLRGRVMHNRQSYADRHGYSHCASSWKPDMLPTSHIRYALLYALHHGLNGLPTFEWALWMDYDAFILDPSQELFQRLGSVATTASLIVPHGYTERVVPVVGQRRQNASCAEPAGVITSSALHKCIDSVRRTGTGGR